MYLSANADVKAAGVNPLTHFDQIGWQEGRLPSLSFDLQQYFAHNADVARMSIRWRTSCSSAATRHASRSRRAS